MEKNTLIKIKERLTDTLGAEKVISDPEILSVYSVDQTSDLRSMPDLVVRAHTTEDVSNTLKICGADSVPVVPRGAGTGVTGGAVPVEGGVVLSLEKMDRILEIDRENMVALVEPGAITGIIQSAVREVGLMYPPDPASLDSCSIGGNVSEIAGGPRAVKYGTTKDYILGLEFVLPDGSIITSGGKFVKNATGYNLTGLLLGSEGTLAVITKIFLKLIPAPSHSLDLLIPFNSLEDAFAGVHTILINRITPSTIEFMEKDAIDLVSRYLKKKMPFPDAGAHLLIQIDGQSNEIVYKDLEQIGSILSVPQESILVAESRSQSERLWKARRSIREAIHAVSPVFLAEDSVVPRSKIPEFIIKIKSFLSSQGLHSVIFGHAGDGNCHIDVLKGEIDYETWKKIIPNLKMEIYKSAIALGGTITGEHGIGFTRKEYLSLTASPAEIELLKRIKKAFDPDGILNPGKIME